MSENERLDQIPEEEPIESVEESKSEKKSKADKAADRKAREKAKKKAKGNRIARWFREMRSELKKVQWPSWKKVLKNTGVVLLCVLVIGIFIWVFDWLAHVIIQALMNLFS